MTTAPCYYGNQAYLATVYRCQVSFNLGINVPNGNLLPGFN